MDYLATYADYISVHRYVGNHNDNSADFLAVTNSTDNQIEEAAAVSRYAQAKNRRWNRAAICRDHRVTARRLAPGWHACSEFRRTLELRQFCMPETVM